MSGVRKFCPWCLALLLGCGCASDTGRQAAVEAAFREGQDVAFEQLRQNGIAVVRMEGPFERRVILWQAELTLAKAMIEAGYQLDTPPARILLQRGREVQPVDPAKLLSGADVALEAGMTVRVLP